MANITRKMFSVFIFMMLSKYVVSVPEKSYQNYIYNVFEPMNSTDILYKILNELIVDINAIKENSIITSKKVNSMFEALKVIKKNSIATAEIEKKACPARYERVAGDCFHYQYIGKWFDWNDASVYCQAIDGELAVTDDIHKFLVYYRFKRNTANQSFPYGASRRGNDILYVNGTVLPTNSNLWEDGYPGSGNCVMLSDYTQKLKTTYCTIRYSSVICKYHM